MKKNKPSVLCLTYLLFWVFNVPTGYAIEKKAITEGEIKPKPVLVFTSGDFGSPIPSSEKKLGTVQRLWKGVYNGLDHGFEPVAVSSRGGSFAYMFPSKKEIRIMEVVTGKLKCTINHYQDGKFLPVKLQYINQSELGVVSISRQVTEEEVKGDSSPMKLIRKLYAINLDIFSTSTGELIKRIPVSEKGKILFQDNPILGKRGVDELPCFHLSPDTKWLVIGYSDWIKVYDRSSGKMVLHMGDEMIPSPSGDKIDSVCFTGFSHDSEYLLVRRAWWTTCISLFDHTIQCSWLKVVISTMMNFAGVQHIDDLMEYLEGFSQADLIHTIQFQLEEALRGIFQTTQWNPKILFVYDETTDPRTQPVISSKNYLFVGSDDRHINILAFNPFLMETISRFNIFEEMCLYLANDKRELIQTLGELMVSLFTRSSYVSRIRLKENPNFLAISPGGHWLFTGGDEKNTRLIDLKYKKEHLQIVPANTIDRAWFLQDGRHVVVMQVRKMDNFEFKWGGISVWNLGPWLN